MGSVGHWPSRQGATTTKTDYCSARTSALCCRTQGRLQERTAHRGHWYLEAHVVQISHIGTGLAAAAGGEGGAVAAGVVDSSIISKISAFGEKRNRIRKEETKEIEARFEAAPCFASCCWWRPCWGRPRV